MINPQRTIDDLKELRALTANDRGAWRVAWTDTWLQARAWFKGKVGAIPGVQVSEDAAGNIWAVLPGATEQSLLMGSHLDCVPGGGWLDGCLGVVAGIEVLRHFAAMGTPPVTVKLIDWADEEGARFGRSLLGSAAFAGNHSIEADRVRTDKEGVTLETAMRRCGVDIGRAGEATEGQKNAAAYIELHIEQGPVLEQMNLPLGIVTGTKGVERHAITFFGQAVHSGATPMPLRKDALAAAAKLALEIRTIAGKHPDAVCTMGSVKTFPGIVTAVVGRCETTLDQRDLDTGNLAQMYREAKEASERFAAEEGCTVQWSRIWDIEPIPFHPELLDLCEQAVFEASGTRHRLPSGPLHDAAEVARCGIPTVMIFTQSLLGISHNKIEDTREEHLHMGVDAFGRLADKTAAWILARQA